MFNTPHVDRGKIFLSYIQCFVKISTPLFLNQFFREVLALDKQYFDVR